MKVFVLAPKENWICDRFVSEWISAHPLTTTSYLGEADLVWLLADWCWNQVPINILRDKKVLASVHHIVPEKFNEQSQQEFAARDEFVDAYHVPCIKTHDQIRPLTTKPIYTFPFWVNQSIWNDKRSEKDALRKKYGISSDVFLIGSFQRDTEGHDLKSPKLEKGPDLFCDAVIAKRNYRANKVMTNVEVLLAGWRRQYVMKRLDDSRIKYHYQELPSLETINEFYSMLDLYIVAARYEGGPQAIFECSLTNTPIISTDVGAASMILSKQSIFKPGESISAKPNTEAAYRRTQQLIIPSGFLKFEEALNEIIKKKKTS
jgi:glycosyltransferase involved in cell wall biosynthesis